MKINTFAAIYNNVCLTKCYF